MTYFLSILLIVEVIIFLFILSWIIYQRRKTSVRIFKNIFSLSSLKRQEKEYRNEIIKRRNEIARLNEEWVLLRDKLNLRTSYFKSLKSR